MTSDYPAGVEAVKTRISRRVALLIVGVLALYFLQGTAVIWAPLLR